jgi:hypothetical protein
MQTPCEVAKPEKLTLFAGDLAPTGKDFPKLAVGAKMVRVMGFLDSWLGRDKDGWLSRPPFDALDKRERKIVRALMNSRKVAAGATI